MKITEIVVEVHEKRNHPYAFGHRDCSVRLTALVDYPVEMRKTLNKSIVALRETARLQVEQELDLWISGIECERELKETYEELRIVLRWVKTAKDPSSHIEQVGVLIAKLPEAERSDYNQLLADAIKKNSLREEDGIPF